MNKNEFDEKILKIHARANKEKQALYKEYALSNSSCELGEIVKDHRCIIKIKQIKIMIDFGGYPECYYRGPKLRKDLTPYKSGEFESIYQSNIKG